MNVECRRYLEQFLDRCGDAEAMESISSDLARADHARECKECARTAARMAKQASGLAGMQRLEAPHALEGRVVAELYAGRRQDRASSALRRLPRLPVPEELERAFGGGPHAPKRLGAPAILRELVEEELSHPVQARIERQLGRLARMHAPAALDARVEAALAGRTAPRESARAWRRWTWVAVAAGVAVLAAAGIRALPRPTPRYSFQVVEAHSIREMSPFARSWIAAVGGGVLEQARVEPSGAPDAERRNF
jgi:hypothetical protein